MKPSEYFYACNMLECSDSDFEKMWPKVNKRRHPPHPSCWRHYHNCHPPPCHYHAHPPHPPCCRHHHPPPSLLVIIIVVITNRGVGVPSQWESSAPIVLMPALMKGSRFPFLQIAFANRCILNIIIF